MTRNELMKLYKEMIELLGERTMLNGLFYALSTDELEDKLKYIARCTYLTELYEE